ncbi:MAG: glutamate racemase [Balneolaceae bacterium]|nr:glutamate racemase [Balneolaceae bacterium]
MSDSQAPIGIFDSGIGGLTVVKAVREALPGEHIIYFGDTARVPYGIKSEETVRGYALQITRFLLERDVKMILIACNTVSASAKELIVEEAGDIPVLDVITAGTQAALQEKGSRHIGVIGTLATVGSGAYEKAIRTRGSDVKVSSEACPLLVPLAEEGWTDNRVARDTLSIYLERFEGSGIDSLILGCTHYPLFTESIRQILDHDGIRIIDSAHSIAEMSLEVLRDRGLLNTAGHGTFECYVSDRPQRFQELAERFLGTSIPDVHIAQLA